MQKRVIQLPVEKLKIGQYVRELDRPWSGTPFLFQGFEIQSDEELAQIRSLCRVVHVEVSVEEAEEAARRTPEPSPPPPHRESSELSIDLSALLSSGAHQAPIEDAVSLRSELAPAREVHSQARQVVGEIFNRARKGGSIDASMLESTMDSMVDSVFRNRDALGWLARMKRKDDYLYTHSLASSVWALAFGRHLGLDKDTLKSLGIGAILLDIGKTRLPDHLLRGTSPLSDSEWSAVRKHVELGLSMVKSDANADDRVRVMIGTHHERVDGSGYPRRLRGDAIPLVGRIAGIVDSYDAMTSNRAHAKGKSTYEAVLELKKLGGSWFQPELVELFIQAVGVFPTGTLVELNTGEVGVVVAQNRFRRLRPEIMLILDESKKVLAEFKTIDLQVREQVNASGEPALWITQGLEPGAHGIDPTEYFL